MTLVGSRLIIKLFKQLIKRKKKKVNQIGYRLQLMYAANRAGSERPRLIRSCTHACQEQFVRRQPALFIISSKPSDTLSSTWKNKSFVSWGGKKKKEKKTPRCCYGNPQHTRAGRTVSSLSSPFVPILWLKIGTCRWNRWREKRGRLEVRRKSCQAVPGETAAAEILSWIPTAPSQRIWPC